MSAPILRTDSVSVVRSGRALIADVSVSIEPGQHWVFLGPNGAGKSTLLGLLGAHTHPTTGTVEVLGHRLGRVDMRALRSSIGHVNPRHPLDHPLRVREVVLTGAPGTVDLPPRWTPDPEHLERAAALIDAFGMTARAEARWDTLSQGERGRALIARALMPEPRLLLLDEPATGLDLTAREQLLIALDQVRRDRPTLASVLVTHHIEEIPASTTHAILLRDGRVLAQGAAESVLSTDNVSECFAHPIRITRDGGRWSARTAVTV